MVDIRKNAQWLFLLSCSEIAVQSVLKIILAFMLSPDALGVVGFALILIGFLQSMSQTGVYAALIQQRNIVEDYLDTGWSLEIVRGFILFVAIYSVSPWYVEYMLGVENREYQAVIQLLAVTVFIDATKNIGIVLFDKEINFKQVLKLQISGLIVRTFAILMLTLYLKSYWGIVFGTVIGSLTIFFMSYVVSDYRPKFNIELSKCKELLGFGGWVFAYTIVGYLVLKMAEVFALKYEGIAELAIFQMGFFMAMLMRNSISEIQNRIIFPLVSSFKLDSEKIEKLYIESVELSLFFYLPSGLGLAILSESIVKIMFTEQWISVANILPVLAVAGIFASLVRVIEQFYKGFGVPQYLLVFMIINILVFVVCITLVFDHTLAGISYSFLVAMILQFGFIFIHSLYFFRIQINPLFKTLLVILTGAILMSVAMVCFYRFISDDEIVSVLALTMVGVTTYFIYLLMAVRFFHIEGIENLLSMVRLSMRNMLGFSKL
ncbi:oligosaccharide flippase family protein [Gammaproteobacteria bacterium]|nr:oligosaccharide flippase family protein [Gammaproteobacteria bacterium]